MTTAAQHDTVMDPTAQRLARIYAQALLACVSPDEAETLGEELAAVIEAMDAVAGFGQAQASGALSRNAAQAMLDRALADRVSTPVRALVASMGRRGRLTLLPTVAAQFRKVLDQQAGKVEAILTSAQPLTDDQRQRAMDRLTETLDAPVVLHPRVDPRLIGGAVVEVDGVTYDSSVRAQLRRMAQQATDRFERSEHEKD